MTRRARQLTVIVAFMTAGGCGVPGQTHPTQLDNNDVHIATPATTTSLPPGTRTRHVELCLLSDDHLIAVPTELPTPLSASRTLQALVDASRTGLPTGTRSALNGPNLVTANTTTRGVAHIELNAAFTQTPAADQILAVAQIVCTLTSLPGIGQVQFTRDGNPIDIPRADSSLTNQPVTRADYKPLLPTK